MTASIVDITKVILRKWLIFRYILLDMYKVIYDFKKPCGKNSVKYYKVLCTTHDNIFEIKAAHFHSGSTGCCGCQDLHRLGNCDNKRHLLELDKYPDNFIFCPNKGKWEVKCTKCDMVWSSTLDKLKQGQKGCRCSKRGNWNKEERVKQIAKIIEGDTSIVSFELDTYVTTIDSILLVGCKHHGVYKCTVNNFVNHSSRCPKCAREVNRAGYYETKKDIEDYLYLLLFTSDKECFIKVGRSFKPESRMKVLARGGNYNIKSLLILKGRHKDVFGLEKEIITSFRDDSYRTVHPFKGDSECFNIEAKGEIMAFIKLSTYRLV